MNRKIQIIARALYEALLGEDKAEGESGKENAIRNTILLLKKEKLLSKSQNFIDTFTEIVDKNNNTVRAEVTTRQDLTESEITKVKHLIKQKFKAEHVIVSEKIDKNIIGGIKIKTGDTLIDGSLGSRMRNLEKQLLN